MAGDYCAARRHRESTAQVGSYQTEMGDIHAVTDAEFESLVLKSEVPVLVDFWATWCPPCRMIAPIVEQIQGELGDRVKVMKMDTDENPATSMSLGIMSIPTVIIFKDGKAAERTVGYRPDMKAGLKAKLEALI
jgi:thioredoxin 1